MCDKNTIVAGFDTMVAQKSDYRPGYPSWFHFSVELDLAHELWSFVKMAAHAIVARARYSKHQSNHQRAKPAAGSEN